MTAAECQNIAKERKGLDLHSATFSEPNAEGKRLRLENKLKKLKNAANCESQAKAHPDTRYLYLVCLGPFRKGAAGAHGEGKRSRTSEGLASAVGGDAHVGAQCAGVGRRARHDAGSLQVLVRDVPSAVPPVSHNCHAEGLPRSDEGGPLVCRYNTLSCSVSVGDGDVPLSAPRLRHEEVTDVKPDATAWVRRRDRRGAELDACGNNERRAVPVGGNDLGRHAAHSDGDVVGAKAVAGDGYLCAHTCAGRGDAIDLPGLGRRLRVGARGQRRCPGKRRCREHNGKTLEDRSCR